MARFAITLTQPAVRDGQLNEPIGTSVRESRAKRHARKLVSAGKKNVMLWRIDGSQPVPIRYREDPPMKWPGFGNRCNSTRIEMDLPELVIKNAPGTRSKAAHMDFLRKRNRAVVIAMEAHDA